MRDLGSSRCTPRRADTACVMSQFPLSWRSGRHPPSCADSAQSATTLCVSSTYSARLRRGIGSRTEAPSLPRPRKRREHRVQRVPMLEHARQCFARSRAGLHRDFDGANHFDSFATGDTERASLIATRNAPRGFGNVPTSALRSTKRLIPRIPIRDSGITHRAKQLQRNAVGLQPMMRQQRCRCGCVHCHSRPPSPKKEVENFDVMSVSSANAPTCMHPLKCQR